MPLVGLDYKQLELRIAAQVWPDPVFIQTLQAEDVHDSVARTVFGIPPDGVVSKEQRVRAKNCVFGWLYRSKGREVAEQIADEMKCPVDDVLPLVEEFIAKMSDTFPGLEMMVEATRMEARTRKILRTITGWRLAFNFIGKVREDEEQLRFAVNSMVQGPAAQLTYLGQVLLDTWLRQNFGDQQVRGEGPLLVNNVHDALYLDVPTSLTEPVARGAVTIMENLPTEKVFGWALNVPLKVDVEVGPNLGNMVGFDTWRNSRC